MQVYLCSILLIKISLQQRPQETLFSCTAQGGGGGYSQEFLVGLCRSVLQILTLFQTNKCDFPLHFSDLASKIHARFQTWSLRNSVFITQIRTRAKRFLNIHFEFAYYSFFLIHLELKRQRLPSVARSKAIPYSRPKWAKCIPVFRPARRKNPTRWVGTYLYSLYKGVSPPPPDVRLHVV